MSYRQRNLLRRDEINTSHKGIFMPDGNRPSSLNNLPPADEIYPVYERERTPNWILLAAVAAMIYWIMTSYFGH